MRGSVLKGYASLALLGVSFLAFSQSQQPRQSIHDPSLTTPPDKNQQMGMQEDQSKKQGFEKANAERKRQIVDDTTKLLELATPTQIRSRQDQQRHAFDRRDQKGGVD